MHTEGVSQYVHLTVLVYPFYVMFHCLRPVPILENRSTGDSNDNNPQMLFMSHPKYQRYISCMFAKRDQSHGSLCPKFVLGR